MNRRRIIGLAVLAALLIAGVTTRGFGLWAARPAELTLYGNVDVRQVELGFRLPGRIAELMFEEGAKVPPGAVLAKLDPQTLNDTLSVSQAAIEQADAELARARNGNRSQDIARAQAGVAEAQALLAKAKEDYDRRSALLPSGAVSEAAVNASRGEYRAAAARLQSAQAALSLQTAGSRREDIVAAAARRTSALAQANKTRTDLSDTALIAPDGGTVLTRARERGAIVQAGETVYTLTIDRPMRVRAYIAQADITRISPGMAVTVSADGNAKAYHGTIGFISPTAEFTPKSVQTESLRADLVYRLRIDVRDPDDALRQGQPVTIAVPQARPAKN